MKKKFIAFVLMFIVSLVLIQPAKAATTAIAITGASGTFVVSTDTGATATITTLNIPGTVAIEFNNTSTGQSAGFLLSNGRFSQSTPISLGSHTVNGVFPSSSGGAYSADISFSGSGSAATITGEITLTELVFKPLTQLPTAYAGYGQLTVNGNPYFVSFGYNSSSPLAAAPVPEPSIPILCTLGLLVMVRRKR